MPPLTLEQKQLREALRGMLLPVSKGHENESLQVAANNLQESGVPSADLGHWVRLRAAEWYENKSVSPELARVIRAYLKKADSSLGEALATHYLRLHRELQGPNYLLSHNEASAFLSHALLIYRLASLEQMSSAQIARLFKALGGRLPFNYPAIKFVLRKLGQQQALQLDEVKSLFERDKELEEATFLDADTQVAAAAVGELGSTLGFPGDLKSFLLRLALEGSTHGPYLQMLHYQCLIAEFFDHAVTYLYEFEPRGNTALWLFDQYPSSLSGAGNPFLNNAKSVEQINSAWARSKGPLQAQAHALVAVLAGLEEMGFAARHELAGLIRRWLLRIIRLRNPLGTVLPSTPEPDSVESLLANIRTNPSQTSGIIEQRLVDALTCLKHSKAQGWRSRGLGDSVNASNVSKRKLGDCDYQHSDQRKVVAYESHAGMLTEVYLQEHRRVLEKILPLRQEEWNGIADPEEWSVEINFVAHGFAITPPADFAINGVRVHIVFSKFGEFIPHSTPTTEIIAVVKDMIYTPMNEKRTPDRARKRLLELGASLS